MLPPPESPEDGRGAFLPASDSPVRPRAAGAAGAPAAEAPATPGELRAKEELIATLRAHAAALQVPPPPPPVLSGHVSSLFSY